MTDHAWSRPPQAALRLTAVALPAALAVAIGTVAMRRSGARATAITGLTGTAASLAALAWAACRLAGGSGPADVAVLVDLAACLATAIATLAAAGRVEPRR